MPELLKFPDQPIATGKFVAKRDTDFFVKMENYSQEAVINLDNTETVKEEISRSKLLPCSAALKKVFSETSSQRLKS